MKNSSLAVLCIGLCASCFIPGCFNSGETNAPKINPSSSAPQDTEPSAKGNPALSVAGTSALDASSDGGTITFQSIGAAGWYPSRRDPATGPCDAYTNGSCCMAKHLITSDSLTPWNEELIMTLRGPMIVRQIAVYQPDAAQPNLWDQTSMWDTKNPTQATGIAFTGNNTETRGFTGPVGNTCLVNVSTNKKFSCGPGSVPYCAQSTTPQYFGWEGSKMIIVLAYMPHVSSNVIDSSLNCGNDTANNWYDAPWIGLSHGELVRAGAFGSCQCYAKDPSQWWLADGCGQFNAFEVVNDNNSSQNFNVFSTNFFGYGGYVGEGPCGTACKVSGLPSKVDLVNKTTSLEAATGAVASPTKGPGAALRRPATGYRFFVMLLDVQTRMVQLALIHPANVPTTVSALLPGLPAQVSRAIIDNALALRLPGPAPLSVINK